MATENADIRDRSQGEWTEIFIRVGLIGILAYLCLDVFAPFANLMLWAIILAIALYPLHQGLAKWLGGKPGSAATLLVVVGLLLIGTPTVMLGSSFADRAHQTYSALQEGAVSIKSLPVSVAEWPLIGNRVYSGWSQAADDLPAYLKANKEQVLSLSRRALSAAASALGGVLLFLGSLIVAGIIMAFGEGASKAARRIFVRVTDPGTGPRLQSLCTATVRSVASGVIGVAFIQALLLGVGFMLAGIPAAGVLAVVVMLVGILQLPALIISLPAIGYLWWSGDASTASNIAFSIYLLVAGMADNVLKPLLLGRGVDAPMPVILLGALGGMVSAGIIGLFVGAVLLAVGYQLFMEWVDAGQGDGESASSPQQPADQSAGALE